MKKLIFIVLIAICINTRANTYTNKVNWFDGCDSITIKVLFTDMPTNKAEFNHAFKEIKDIKHKNDNEKRYYNAVMDALERQSTKTDYSDRFYECIEYSNIIIKNNFDKRNTGYGDILLECYRIMFLN